MKLGSWLGAGKLSPSFPGALCVVHPRSLPQTCDVPQPNSPPLLDPAPPCPWHPLPAPTWVQLSLFPHLAPQPPALDLAGCSLSLVAPDCESPPSAQGVNCSKTPVLAALEGGWVQSQRQESGKVQAFSKLLSQGGTGWTPARA